MGDPAAAALEVAIADAGLLLVELEKFRGGRDEPVTTLRAEALALGQRARRLHRAHGLDDTTAAPLALEAANLLERLREARQALRASAGFRAAVAAHRAGDHAALAILLPRLFEDLEYVESPPPLFRPVTWLRRNRARPPIEVARDVARLRDEGLPADGDAQAPGTDPELPAVALLLAPPPEPIRLRFASTSLPPVVFRVRATQEHLVHVPVLSAPFDVVLPLSLDPDELGEISLDHPRYRAELVAALTSAGFRVQSA